MRYPRLESLFGTQIDDADEASLARLVANTTDESADLDFKAQLHSDNRDLAQDVAAFANLQGGVIVVGIEEDGDGRAGHLAPQPLTEDDELRVKNVIADLVRPYVAVAVRRFESSAEPGLHYMTVSVPASRDAPHFVRKGDANLKCPCRDGKRTRYLAESEIADRYRSRFAFAEGREGRLDQVIALGRKRLDVDRAWICLAVVPVLAGEFRLGGGGSSSLGAWIQPLRDELPALGVPPLWQSALLGKVGPQRFSVRDGLSGSAHHNPALWGLLDLHTDGSMFGAMAIGHGQSETDANGSEYVSLWDTPATRDIAGLLTVAAKHAVDNTRTEGDALCRVVLVPSRTARIGFRETYRARQTLPIITVVDEVVQSDRTVNLSSIYSSAPELLSATRIVLEEVVQEFGVSEPATVTEEGGLVVSNLEDHVQASARQWAAACGVFVS